MSFPKYESYKDSGVEWLGEVPSSWSVIKIRHTTYVKGRVGWHGLSSDEFSNEGVHLVTGTDFKNGFVFWDTCYRITEKRFNEDPYIKLKENDLLITKDGTIGKLARVKNMPEKASLNSGIFLIRALKKVYLEEYLYWVLQSSIFSHFMDLTKVGSTIQHLYQEVFNRFTFPSPTPPEQRLIAAFLDRETVKIDDLIAEQQRFIALLTEKRQAVISHAVTKGLNPDAPMKDSGVEWLGKVPTHWSVEPVAYRYNIQLGKMLDTEKITGDHLRPYLRVFDVQWGEINTEGLPQMDFDKDARSKFRLLPGDLIVNEGGSYPGRSAIWQNKIDECYYQKALHRVRPYRPQEDTTRFLYYVMYWAANRGVFVAGGNETTIEHLPAEKLRRYRFAFPPIAEQYTIASFIDRETGRINTLILEAQRGIELLQERRSALISAVVTGKIDVRGAVLARPDSELTASDIEALRTGLDQLDSGQGKDGNAFLESLHQREALG